MDGNPNAPRSDIDRFIGQKVKWFRRGKHMMAEVLALKIGMDLDAYKASERGVRRFTSSELYQLSVALSVGLTDFYPSIEPEIDASLDPAVASPSEFEMHEVMHYFSGITDPGVRESILASIKLVSSFEA